MERRILAELFVDDDRAIEEDMGTIDYVFCIINCSFAHFDCAAILHEQFSQNSSFHSLFLSSVLEVIRKLIILVVLCFGVLIDVVEHVGRNCLL